MNMSNHNHPGSVCAGCDRDFTVTTSNVVELDTYDQLLIQLLSVKDFISCSLFPHVFHTRLNVLLDRLSESGRSIPYVPPSVELVQAVRKFVNLVVANKCLFDGIISSTGAGLNELYTSCS